LSALEIEDLVTVRDVAAVAQRLEMVRRIAGEIEGYVVELGTDGRLLSLQLDELIAGVEADRELVARDYLPPAGRRARRVDDVLTELDQLSPADLLDLGARSRGRWVTAAPASCSTLPSPLAVPAAGTGSAAAGHRRRPARRHFGTLQKLLGAGIDDLQAVEGVGESRARTVREGLSRLAESSILERYV